MVCLLNVVDIITYRKLSDVPLNIISRLPIEWQNNTLYVAYISFPFYAALHHANILKKFDFDTGPTP